MARAPAAHRPRLADGPGTSRPARLRARWALLTTAPDTAARTALLRPAAWTRTTTTELLELISVLTLLSPLREETDDFAARSAAHDDATGPGAAELRAAGILPVTAARRGPASVLDHHEEGPDGQFALL